MEFSQAVSSPEQLHKQLLERYPGGLTHVPSGCNFLIEVDYTVKPPLVKVHPIEPGEELPSYALDGTTIQIASPDDGQQYTLLANRRLEKQAIAILTSAFGG